MTKEVRKIVQDYRRAINKHMDKNKISQKEVAAALGVHYSYVSKALNNHSISLITMEKIADVLDLKIELKIRLKYDFKD